jgi:hypothetical protein
MGFPKNFKIPVSDTQAYRQFGNSVVVPVIQRIAKRVVATLADKQSLRTEFQLTPFEPPPRNRMISMVLPLSFAKVNISNQG